MSKTINNTGSHLMAIFQMRAVALSEAAQSSGALDVAVATSRSGMVELVAQNAAQQKEVE